MKRTPMRPPWKDHILSLPDHNMAWYEVGEGPAVVIINGGPGDDHSYMRPVGEALSPRFRCVLYDQRGTGHSHLQHLNEHTLNVDRLVADLEALRIAAGIDRMMLVGHSWGANLALLYASIYPANVSRLALISMGPFDEALSAVADANLMHPLSREEREEWANLKLERKIALRQEDLDSVHTADKALMRLRVRGWFYSPEKAEKFLNYFMQAADNDRTINDYINRSYRRIHVWDTVRRVAAPVLVIYGYQDFEPISLGYMLQQRMSLVELYLLNECGHVPWLEQPELFYRELTRFLTAGSDQLQQKVRPG